MTDARRLGIVLFAHGSRDARWRAPVERVAARVRELSPHILVRCAYLEIIEPDLPQAARELIAEGASRVRVLPLFLGVGKHVREDLPRLVALLQAEHSQATFELLGAVGESEALIHLLADMALATMPQIDPFHADDDTT